mgnify:CR=1 FL=1
MIRGLKAAGLLKATRDEWEVAVHSPMIRGLKVHGRTTVAICEKFVAVHSPMIRGLKGKPYHHSIGKPSLLQSTPR